MSGEIPDVKSIYGRAAEIASPTERAAYLAEACGGDAGLRGEVERLLAAAGEAGSFMEGPAVATLHTAAFQRVSEGPGTLVGPYKLMEQIGEGGFGLVFVAEQHRPVRRKVALKIIKPGMDTRDVIARFEAERQALALMDHPNIAKVFDAGATDSGRPYFVMELVRGIPITEYCDQHHLTPRERLDLFLSLCHAIQHAHQKGIIHRDVKPTNVLVTLHDGRPVVKVIDFGVAKALSQQLTERTIYTQFAQMLGTPLYMSPEQASMSGLDIDTRSDIYSLGVLLYELLTGTTPFDRERLKQAAADEIRRIIREEEPPKPSTRISQSGERLPSIAAQRNTEPAKLSKLVRGDLDWIVMKCLEKDRTRRYETANSLVRDVERYLRDEPIEACPPSLGYRFRKLAKRNKRALATAALFSVVVLGALAAVAGSVGWAVRDRAARQTAVEREVSLAIQEAQSAYEKDALSDAMAAVKKADALLASSAPQPQLQRRVEQWKTDLRLVERLEEIRMERGDQHPFSTFSPGTVDAYLIALQNFGLKHLPQLRLAYRLADAGRSHLLPPHLQEVDVSEIADVIRGSPIKPHLVAALDDWATLAPDHDRRVLFAIAREVDDDAWRNRLRDAIQQNDVETLKSLAQEEELVSQPPAWIAILATQFVRSEQYELGTDVLRRAQRRHPGDFWINLDLAKILWIPSADQDDAVGFARAAVARRPNSPGVRLVLGALLEKSGKLAAAEAEFREAVRLKPDYASSYFRLGYNCLEQEKWQEAISVYEMAIQNVPTPHRGSMYVELAEILANVPSVELRNPRRAVEIAGEAVQHQPKNWRATDALGIALYRAGDWQASDDALERSFALTPGPKGRYSIDAKRWLYLSMAHWQMGHKDEAREWYDKAVEWMDKHPGYKELIRFRAEAAELLGVPHPEANQSPSSSEFPAPTADDQ
ncbi:MAG: serine/threonine-protein kinase [Planctomycetes bacterium]|nr:serine/threonine-protein kinase [Planctomycetota bacterium]